MIRGTSKLGRLDSLASKTVSCFRNSFVLDSGGVLIARKPCSVVCLGCTVSVFRQRSVGCTGLGGVTFVRTKKTDGTITVCERALCPVVSGVRRLMFLFSCSVRKCGKGRGLVRRISTGSSGMAASLFCRSGCNIIELRGPGRGSPGSCVLRSLFSDRSCGPVVSGVRIMSRGRVHGIG